MKKLLFIPAIFGVAMITSCGPSAAEVEAKQQAEADSIAAVVEAERQQAEADSIAAVQAAEAEQAMQDSLRQVAIADSIAAAGASKKGKKK